MVRRLLPILAALSLLGCATAAPGVSPSPAGVVSAADPRATAAGVEMLRAGGSAADAAFATLIALTVVEPQSSGIGGGGFLVYSEGGRTAETFDGRETAPAAATGTWFFKDGRPMGHDEAVPGGKSVGVPGNVRMMALAHARHGKLPWAQLFAPAIRLARDGFVVTPRFHRFIGEYRETGALSAEARALFYTASGEPVAVGTRLRNPALAAYLEQLARLGPDSFYVGPNAQAIVATVNGSARNPSAMTAGDLATYDAKQRDAVCGTYRGYKVCGMGPPSSGATTVIATLKQLERFDLRSLGPSSPRAWHLIADSMRLAYADRDQYLADADFVAVPTAGLIDPGYLAERSGLIAVDRALASAEPGVPPGAAVVARGLEPAERGTSHFVATDRWGNVASLTSTIESPYGSGLMVNGYFLNNELTDFSFVPERGGVPVANRVEGGKRPRSSMAPTIVWGPDGEVRLAVGAAGGATIPAQVLRVIIGVIDWRLSAQDAIALPVLFAPGDTVAIEPGTSLVQLAPELRRIGHNVVERQMPLKTNAVERVDGRWVGAADPRSEGVAIGQ